MNHHALVQCSSLKFTSYTASHMLSLSIKVNVVAATGGDGFYGDKEAKNSQLCMPTSFVTGGYGHMLTTTG